MSEQVWLGDGPPPDGVLIYQSGSYGLRACSCCPACVGITCLWQARMLASLAGMTSADPYWPGKAPPKLGRPRKKTRDARP